MILHGDALTMLKTLPDESVHCCVTSPPYWGLRDYGTANWEGGEQTCKHTISNEDADNKAVFGERVSRGMRDKCLKCGAIRIDKQLGLEKTPQEYIAKMVEVFREVRRVLRKDGTCWVNIGDSYATSPPGNKEPPKDEDGVYKRRMDRQLGHGEDANKIWHTPKSIGLKPKDLCLIPFRLAIALQEDGWWIRSDIIWAKNNPMPESVTDRPTKSHEYLFLLTKASKYYFDAEAVREQTTDYNEKPMDYDAKKVHVLSVEGRMRMKQKWNNPAGRNIRTVWTIATQPTPEAHFATFPEALIVPCIKAGTSEKGCCPECRSPWDRVTERGNLVADSPEYKPRGNTRGDSFVKNAMTPAGETKGHPNFHYEVKHIGWQPTCKCGIETTEPCTVLDPFFGSGTTGIVAKKLQRNYIGIELNPEYIKIAEKRIEKECGGLF